MHLDTPHVIDVIASGIHDVKNSLFDALARVYAARQAIRNDRAADALPALAETEHAMAPISSRGPPGWTGGGPTFGFSIGS